MPYLDMTPEQLLARRAAVRAANAENLTDDQEARAAHTAAAALRARAFVPTDAVTDREKAHQAPATVEQAPAVLRAYRDNVPGFKLALTEDGAPNDVGIYVPADKFDGEAPRYSKEALDYLTARGRRPARVFAFVGPSDTGAIGASVPLKGTEAGHKGEGSFLPRGIMREQFSGVGGEAIEQIAQARKLHRKAAKTGAAIVRRAVPLFIQALISRGKLCRASRLSDKLVNPFRLAPLVARGGATFATDVVATYAGPDGSTATARRKTERGARNAVLRAAPSPAMTDERVTVSRERRATRAVVSTRSAHSAHVPSCAQALLANETERRERRAH